MIVFHPTDFETLRSEAEAAYPRECCGLLAGKRSADRVLVSQIVPSPNLAAGPQTDRFEVDPQVRFDLMRTLDGTDEDIIGHYHSHPNHQAQPSDTDRNQAYEPDLIWVIAAVDPSGVGPVRAFQFFESRGDFSEIPLLLTGQSA